MGKPIILDLGTLDIGAGETGAAVEVCFQYGWSIVPNVLGTAGNATYTVQVSQDGVVWKDYNSLAIDVDIEDAVQDSQLNFSFIRVVTSSGGASSGDVEFKLELKK